jgi:hypothetical protein
MLASTWGGRWSGDAIMDKRNAVSPKTGLVAVARILASSVLSHELASAWTLLLVQSHLHHAESKNLVRI